MASQPTRTQAVETQTIDIVTSIEEIGRDAWDELARASGAAVFYRYDFLNSVQRSPLTRSAQAFYLVSRDGGRRPQAALVVYLQETVDPFATGPTDHIGPERMLVGGIWHCYDTTLLSAAPASQALVDAFCAALHELADELGAGARGLVNVAWDSPLATQLRAAGLPAQETTPRYRLVVTPRLTAAAHLATAVGRSSRRCLGRYVRRAQAAGVRTSLHEAGPGLAPDVLALCEATAAKHAPGYYPPAELSELAARLGPACRVLRVELHGELLAASICLLDEDRAHFWAGGASYPDQLNWSPQYVLFAAELEAGLATGRGVVEFGRRNDEFKRRYGLTPLRLGRFVARPPGERP